MTCKFMTGCSLQPGKRASFTTNGSEASECRGCPCCRLRTSHERLALKASRERRVLTLRVRPTHWPLAGSQPAKPRASGLASGPPNPSGGLPGILPFGRFCHGQTAFDLYFCIFSNFSDSAIQPHFLNFSNFSSWTKFSQTMNFSDWTDLSQFGDFSISIKSTNLKDLGNAWTSNNLNEMHKSQHLQDPRI